MQREIIRKTMAPPLDVVGQDHEDQEHDQRDEGSNTAKHSHTRSGSRRWRSRS